MYSATTYGALELTVSDTWRYQIICYFDAYCSPAPVPLKSLLQGVIIYMKMDTDSLNTSLQSGGHSMGTESPNLSMKSWGFTNNSDTGRSQHWNFFLAANFLDVGKSKWLSAVAVLHGKIPGLLFGIIKSS